MSQLQSPPASLLRLREADVVRLCGLDAAARGLEFSARHAVSGGRRNGPRLEATITDEAPFTVWAEIVERTGQERLEWQCPRHAQGGPFGCPHVAAVLTAWIRAPSDFVTPLSSSFTENTRRPSPEGVLPSPSDTAQSQHAQMKQPQLLAEPSPRRRKGTGLADELARVSEHELVAIAQRLLGANVPVAEARTLLTMHLSNPAQVARITEKLEERPRRLLTEIVLLRGVVTVADLEGIATRSEIALSSVKASITVLERHGLIFRAPGGGIPNTPSAEHPWRQVVGWRVPPELRAALSPSLPLTPLPIRDPQHGSMLPSHQRASTNAPRSSGKVTFATPAPLVLALALLARAPQPYGITGLRDSNSPHSEKNTSARRQRGLLTIAGDLAQGPLAECARGAGVAVDVVRLARRLLLWERERGDTYPLREIASVSPTLRATTVQVGFHLWANVEAPIELADLNQSDQSVRVSYDPSHPALRPAALATEARNGREFVLWLLSHAQVNEWYSIEDLLNMIWRINPLFLRGRQMTYSSPGWWFEQVKTRKPLRPLVAEEWQRAEGTYLRSLLTGPLHWWGALDLARDDAGDVQAFRLTAFGRMLLGDEHAHSAPELEQRAATTSAAVLLIREGALAVQPLRAPPGLLDTLEQWAQVTSLAGGRLIYTLSPDLASANFDKKESPSPLLKRLRSAGEAGGARIASSVEERLNAWFAQYGNTRIISEHALIEARDEATLVEALAYVPEIAARCHRLSGTVALLPQEDVTAFEAALRRHGYDI